MTWQVEQEIHASQTPAERNIQEAHFCYKYLYKKNMKIGVDGNKQWHIPLKDTILHSFAVIDVYLHELLKHLQGYYKT